jgi:hypothetical protein
MGVLMFSGVSERPSSPTRALALGWELVYDDGVVSQWTDPSRQRTDITWLYNSRHVIPGVQLGSGGDLITAPPPPPPPPVVSSTSNVSATVRPVEQLINNAWTSAIVPGLRVPVRLPIELVNQGTGDSIISAGALPAGYSLVRSSNGGGLPFTLKSVGQQGMSETVYLIFPQPSLDVNELMGSSQFSFGGV